MFLGVTSLRDYVRQFPNDDVGVDEDVPFLGAEEDITMDEYEDHDDVGAPGDRPVRRVHEMVYDGPIAPVGNAFGEPPELAVVTDGDNLSDEVFDEVDELVRDTYDVLAGGGDDDDDVDVDGDLLDDESEDEDNPSPFEEDTENANERRLLDYDFQGELGFPRNEIEELQNDIALQEDMAALAEGMEYHPEEFMRNPPPQGGAVGDIGEGGDGGALFGLFEIDPDEVPLEEVVGLRGHIRTLFDNAGTVLVSNAIFLGVFTLIPLLIGRLTLRIFQLRTFPKKVSLNYKATSVHDLLSKLWPSLSVENVRSVSRQGAELGKAVLQNSSTAVAVAGEKAKNGIPLGEVTAIAAQTVSNAVKEQTVISPTDTVLVSHDNFLIVLLGYGMIALVGAGYIGAISVLRQRYPRVDSPITRQVARLLRYVATFVKIVVLILFEFGIFPLGCGWWLDICTLEILGGTLQSRIKFCKNSPWTCTGGHWVLGIVYMVHISLFISLLREIIKPELLWFLRNPDDPEFHPFRELVEKPLSRHARRMCISVIIYVPLIIAVVYVPAQICLQLLPHVFPFRSEDFSHILVDLPFGNLLVGPLIRLVYFGRPGISMQAVVGTWIKTVSEWLGIAHLVIKDEEEVANQERRNQQVENNVGQIEGLPPGDIGPMQRMLGDGIEDLIDDVDVDVQDLDMDEDEIFCDETLTRKEIRIRATIMIISAWLTLVLGESAMVALPTILGRTMMGWFGLPVRHDLHPFLLGLNVLLGTLSGISRLIKYVETMDTITVLSLGLPYLYMAGKGMLIIFIWLGVIPLAAGLFFELMLVPIRVAHNETPYFCLHQDWAIGLLLLKVWTCIAVTGGLGTKWRERVLRAREGDIIGLNQNFARTMREVVLPVLFSVVTALSVPYSFARGILPLLGAPRWVSNLVYRYAYLVITCLRCGYETTKYSISILRDLHDSIRDEKYLMGKRLYNFMESQEEQIQEH